MRFQYTDIHNHQDPQRPFQRPYLIVSLLKGNRRKDVISLVDSGADLCLFHSDIGRMIGIGIQAAPKLVFQGVSGAKEVAYLHRVDLVVKGLSGVALEVGFTDSIAVGTGLLGQRGFFEQFHINFKLDQKFFEITSLSRT